MSLGKYQAAVYDGIRNLRLFALRGYYFQVPTTATGSWARLVRTNQGQSRQVGEDKNREFQSIGGWDKLVWASLG